MQGVSSGFKRALATIALLGGLLGLTGAKCFDFSKPITAPHKNFDSLTGDLGVFQDEKLGEITWAKHQATIARPMKQILDLLRDHETTKSPRIDEYTVKKSTPPGVFEQHDVAYLIKPFLFVKVQWNEIWQYWLDPKGKRAVVSYEKISGTHYIPHLCASMELVDVGGPGKNETKVSLYEEAKASGRTKEETLKGLRGTIDTLRTKQ